MVVSLDCATTSPDPELPTALRDLYASLGRVLHERRPAWHLTMLSADRMLDAQLRLRTTDVLRTTNGGIPVRVVSA